MHTPKVAKLDHMSHTHKKQISISFPRSQAGEGILSELWHNSVYRHPNSPSLDATGQADPYTPNVKSFFFEQNKFFVVDWQARALGSRSGVCRSMTAPPAGGEESRAGWQSRTTSPCAQASTGWLYSPITKRDAARNDGPAKTNAVRADCRELHASASNAVFTFWQCFASLPWYAC
jgi:hypothetical protein